MEGRPHLELGAFTGVTMKLKRAVVPKEAWLKLKDFTGNVTKTRGLGKHCGLLSSRK